jgi:hypothetical protein
MAEQILQRSDCMICHVLNHVLSDIVKSERTSNHSASMESKHQDFLFIVNVLFVFRDEDKDPDYDTATSCGKHIDKTEWRYEKIPYLFGYIADGFKVRFHAIIHTGGSNMDAKELGIFVLGGLSGQFYFLLAILHMSCLLHHIKSVSPASCPKVCDILH